MRQSVLEHVVFGLVVLTSLVWLDLVPAWWLGRAARLLLGWAFCSTALVAMAGAWIALARSRRRWTQRSL